MADELRWCGVAHEVTHIAGFAPFSFGVPVPSLNIQFGVLPVTDRLPAGRQKLLDRGGGEDFVGSRERNAINAGTERLGRTECIRDVIRSEVDANGLCRGLRPRPCEHQEEQRRANSVRKGSRSRVSAKLDCHEVSKRLAVQALIFWRTQNTDGHFVAFFFAMVEKSSSPKLSVATSMFAVSYIAVSYIMTSQSVK